MNLAVLFLFPFIQSGLSNLVDVNNCNNEDNACYTKKYEGDSKLCGAKACIFKCCPEGQVVVGPPQSCVSVQSSVGDFSNVTVYDYYLNVINKRFQDIFSVIPNKYSDENFTMVSYNADYMDKTIYLEESGVLYVDMPNQYDRWITIPDFCIDYELPENGTITAGPYFWINHVQPERRIKSNELLVVALSVSAFFMALILVVYYWIFPEHMRTLVIKIRICLLLSYICHFVFVAIIISKSHEQALCIVLSFIAYFSILSTCCWLNVMSYDTWLTFRDLLSRNLTPSERKRLEVYKFKRYIAYGWGLPFCMASGLLIINSIDMSGAPWFITPQIPDQGCFLIDGQQLVYQYIPMLILVLANCVLFVLTAINISCMVKGTQALGPVNKQRQRASLKICLRLFVTMGISWLWEVISFLVPAADDFAFYFDLYNGSIGLLIFITFICNKQALKLIKYRYNHLRGRETPGLESYSDSKSVQMKRMNNNSSSTGF